MLKNNKVSSHLLPKCRVLNGREESKTLSLLTGAMG